MAAGSRLPLLLKMASGLLGVDARRALVLAEEAQELATELDAKLERAEACYLRGRCADILLDQETALHAFNEALHGFEDMHDERSIAKTLREISFVHDTLGDLPRALDFQFRALEIDERTGDPSARATTLRMIGLVHTKSGDAATGLEFYRKSLALCTRPEDAMERGKTLNNIGINLKSLGRFDEALAALQEAHDMFVALGLPLQQSATLNNLGLVQECLGDVAGAERTLRDALDHVGSHRLSVWRGPCQSRPRETLHRAGAPRRIAALAHRCARDLRAAPAEGHAV